MAFDGSAIKTLLDGAVAKGAVHGIAALVVGRDGPLFHHAAGEADAGTLFRNASMTKAVATTGALQLVEQGRLGLDATVESILPEFGQLQVLVDHAPALGRRGGVGRSYADAPEIDGQVRLLPPEKASKTLKVGEFARVRIVGAEGHDLVGQPI